GGPGSRSDTLNRCQFPAPGSLALTPEAPSYAPPCKAAKSSGLARWAAPRFPTLCVQTPHLQTSHGEPGQAHPAPARWRSPVRVIVPEEFVHVYLPLRVHSDPI